MTLAQLPDASHTWTPPSAGAGIDSYGIQRPSQSAPIQGALRPPNYHVWPYRNGAGKIVPGIYEFEFTLDELRGGIWKIEFGTFDKTYCFLLESTGESRYEGYFGNPLDVVEQTTPDPSSVGDYTMHSCIFKAQQIIGIGQTTGAVFKYLYKENPATGAITDMTYPAGANLSHFLFSLNAIVFGSTTYMIVGKFGQVAEALSDIAAPPTSAGSMHALTVALTWIVNTDLPDVGVVALAGSTLIAWPPSAAFGDAPTVMTSGLQGGGWLLGLLSLNAGVNRIHYVRPPNSANGLGIQPGLELNLKDFTGRIYSCNQRGQDEQDITKRFGLTFVTAAIPVNGGIVATDRHQVKWNNGLLKKPLRIMSNAPANSDIEHRVMAFSSPDGDQLFIHMNDVVISGASTNTVAYWLRYDWDLGTVSRVSEDIATGATGMQSFQAASGPGLPASPFTGNLIARTGQGSAGSWWTKYEAPSDQNPYQLRHSAGSAAGSGQPFTTSFRGLTPNFTLPGYDGGDYWVGQIIGPPAQNIKNGGAGATLRVTVNDRVVTFSERAPTTKRPVGTREAHDGWSPDLQAEIVGTNSSTDTDRARMAINSLPIKVKGLIRMPKDFEPPANLDPR